MTLLLIAAVVLGLLAGRLLGGRIREIGRTHFVLEWALGSLLAFVLSWPAVASLLGIGRREFVVAWCLGVFLLIGATLMNSRWWGMRVATIGLTMNLIVVAANGAMPVHTGELNDGRSTSPESVLALERSLLHRAADSDTRLAFLGDWIALPPGVTQLVSLGDLFLTAGIGLLVAEMMLARSDSGTSDIQL